MPERPSDARRASNEDGESVCSIASQARACARMATWSQNSGAWEWEVGLILNHSGSGVTAGYSHGAPIKLKLKLLTQWSDHVTQLVQPSGVTLLR